MASPKRNSSLITPDQSPAKNSGKGTEEGRRNRKNCLISNKDEIKSQRTYLYNNINKSGLLNKPNEDILTSSREDFTPCPEVKKNKMTN